MENTDTLTDAFARSAAALKRDGADEFDRQRAVELLGLDPRTSAEKVAVMQEVSISLGMPAPAGMIATRAHELVLEHGLFVLMATASGVSPDEVAMDLAAWYFAAQLSSKEMQ